MVHPLLKYVERDFFPKDFLPLHGGNYGEVILQGGDVDMRVDSSDVTTSTRK